jgi:hypothetical protein
MTKVFRKKLSVTFFIFKSDSFLIMFEIFILFWLVLIKIAKPLEGF